MARSGGVMSIPYPDFVNGTTADADQVDANNADIVAELTNSIAADGQTTPTADLPMGGYNHTGLGTATAAGDSVSLGQVQAGAYSLGGTAGGTKNALTLSPSPAITAYANGQRFVGKIGGTSSDSTVTLAVSGLATKDVFIDGSACSATKFLVANKFYEFSYDGTQFNATRLSADFANNSDVEKPGAQTVWVPAGAMTTRTTNGAASGSAETTTNKVMLKTLDFDDSTDEFAQFSVRMPKSWDEGTFTAQFLWSNASGTGDVVWGLQALSLTNDDALDSAFGTAQTITDSVTAAGDLMQSDTTSAITASGTPSSEDLVIFQVYRDADNGSDTLTGDARLHGIKLIYTTDAANDA